MFISLSQWRLLSYALLLATLLGGCSQCGQQLPSTSSSGSTTADPAQLAERGKSIYNSNCIACHNADPNKDGALGPAVQGSSLALLEARILRAQYPDGYQPKRSTKSMVAMPYLKNEINALHVYLNP